MYYAELTGEASVICGGFLTSVSGVVQSPGFPESSLSSLSCVWIMVAHADEEQLFLLSFSSFCYGEVAVYYQAESRWLQVFVKEGVCSDEPLSNSCADLQWFRSTSFYITFTVNGSSESSKIELAYDSLGKYKVSLWKYC